VDETKQASDWIEALSAAVKDLSPLSTHSGQLDGVLDGILSFRRDGANGEVMFPPELCKDLIEKGLLKVKYS
jgi:hypothetical protein